MSGSGVMVLLPNPMVLPQMRDLAYAVSPGSHTLLSIQHTEVFCILRCIVKAPLKFWCLLRSYRNQKYGNQCVTVLDIYHLESRLLSHVSFDKKMKILRNCIILMKLRTFFSIVMLWTFSAYVFVIKLQ